MFDIVVDNELAHVCQKPYANKFIINGITLVTVKRFDIADYILGYVYDGLSKHCKEGHCTRYHCKHEAGSKITEFTNRELLQEFFDARPGEIRFNREDTRYSVIVDLFNLTQNGSSNAVIILRCPEVFLWAGLHKRIVDYCVFKVSHGYKFVIETNSEHIFNNVRIAVKHKKIDYNKVHMYYPDDIYSLGHIDLQNNARLSEWPKGYFDTNMHEYALLDREE